MNILWLSHFLLYPETGYGALQRSRGLLRQLAGKHNVFLLSYCRNSDLALISSLDKARQDLMKYCRKVRFIPFPFDRKRERALGLCKYAFLSRPYSVSMFSSPDMHQAARDWTQRYGIDVVHADTIGLLEGVLDDLPHCRTLNHHNIESHMMERRSRTQTSTLKKWFLKREAVLLKQYERRACGKYDLNLTVSGPDREKLIAENPAARVAVIENGVDCNYYNHVFRSEKSRDLIFTGSLDWYPNADAVVFFCERIWPRLKERHPGIRLIIIGKDPSKKLRAMLENDPGIVSKGWVEDVRPAVAAARVFVCPIRDGGGTRLKILDALAQGIPVVSTKRGAEGLRLRNGEHLLIADTADEFIARISDLLSDIGLCHALSRNGRRYVEDNYSFPVLGAKLSAYYEDLVRKRGQA